MLLVQYLKLVLIPIAARILDLALVRYPFLVCGILPVLINDIGYLYQDWYWYQHVPDTAFSRDSHISISSIPDFGIYMMTNTDTGFRTDTA